MDDFEHDLNEVIFDLTTGIYEAFSINDFYWEEIMNIEPPKRDSADYIHSFDTRYDDEIKKAIKTDIHYELKMTHKTTSMSEEQEKLVDIAIQIIFNYVRFNQIILEKTGSLYWEYYINRNDELTGAV